MTRESRVPNPFVDGIARVLTATTLVLFGCGSAKIAGQREVGTFRRPRPAVIYVTDFELGAQSIKVEKSVIPPPPEPPARGDAAQAARGIEEARGACARAGGPDVRFARGRAREAGTRSPSAECRCTAARARRNDLHG